MKLTRVGVDLAKQVFQVHGVDRAEKPIWCQRLKRSRWIAEFERNVERGCEIGMEACGGAHHWARLLQSKGYAVKLIAPQFVKPYVKSNKNDANDAEAICEAMSRPSMRYVAVKTVEQQDIQAVHRIRGEPDRGADGERRTRYAGWCTSTDWWHPGSSAHCAVPCRCGWRMRRMG